MTLSNAMTKEDIYPMLVDMLHEMFELDRSKITPDANLYSDLDIDSIDAGVPILAGVVQVDWVIDYGRQCFDLPPVFLGIHALKFQRIIILEKPFTLELVHEPAKSCLTFKITLRVGTHTSGRVMFGAADV
jgi:hypothetical protein